MQLTKSIFVTGAASGIGRETASLFSANGWFVGLVDLDPEGLKSLETDIGPDRCFKRVMDVTDPEGYRAAVADFAKKSGGKMDVLFNNAGILQMGLNESIPLPEQHRIVDTNVKGILTGIDCALPLLQQTPGARIISMCSTSCLYGIPELAVYSATKHAVAALTEALSIELERHGIIVSDIIVPYVNTPMITAARSQAYSVQSTGINVQPRQVAKTVWKAAHGKKIHWKIHYLTYLLFASFWAFPFLRRPIAKYLCLSPVKHPP
jgi:NADP-dependent 3-hydroxy acid dehydrogenase YdfG